MLKIKITISDQTGTLTSEVSTSEVTSDTTLTNIEWIDAIRRSLAGIGFGNKTISQILKDND